MIKANIYLDGERVTFYFNADKKRERILRENNYFAFVSEVGAQHTLFVNADHFGQFVKHFCGTFDWALPQSFFDEYKREHGERPFGVWSYKNDIWGHFVSRDEIVEQMKTCVLAKFNAGQFEMEDL